MTLSLPPQSLRDLLHEIGFGQTTNSGFPGEVTGTLQPYSKSHPTDLATMSFGYGISVTALQLIHAYTIFANNGIEIPLTFLKLDKPPQGKVILDPKIAQEMLAMLETVVQPGGTATAAAIPDYRVAGKTGTAYIAGPGGYDKKKLYRIICWNCTS